jgi:transcriptional antiterminator
MPYLAAEAGTQLEPPIFSLPRWVTQDEIAQLLGTSRESITVHIKKARELGLFTNTDDGFQIDLSKIEDRFIYSRWFSKRNSPQERAHP